MQLTSPIMDPASASKHCFRHPAWIAWACAAALFGEGTNAGADQPPKVDARLVGTWELSTVPGQGVWVLRFDANGKYEYTNEGPFNLPGHSGIYEAGGDHWKTQSTSGTPWTDGGDYQFVDADSMLMSGKLGTATWVRRKGGGAAKPQNANNEKRISDQMAAPGAPVSKVAPLVSAAKTLAKTWQADAALVTMVIKAGADGLLDLKNMQSANNQNGVFVAMNFYSPSAGQVRTYGLDPSGRVVAQGPAMPPGTEITPIPEPFLDLDDALTKARQNGLNPLKSNDKSFIDARISGVKGEYGRPNSAIWKISSWDFSGPVPAPVGEPIELTASTGTVTTWEKESGQLDRQRLVEELRQGKALPLDPRRELAAYRKEADAMAGKWSPELKLSEIAIQGHNPGAKFEIDHLEFFYYRLVPDGWSIFRVLVFGVKGGMLMQGGETDNVLPKANYNLQPAPDKLLPPNEALTKLEKLNPQWDEQHISLRLIFGGSLPPDEKKTPGGEGKPGADADIPADVLKAIRASWLWVSEGKRGAGTEKSGIFIYKVDNTEVFIIDAMTGQPLMSPEIIAAKKPPEPKMPEPKVAREESASKIDLALVGMWQGTSAALGMKLTISFAPSGEYILDFEEDNGKSSQSFGMVQAGGGKFSWASPLDDDPKGGKPERGSYKLSDASTLMWTPAGGGDLLPKSWKRVAATPRPKVDSRLVGTWQGTSDGKMENRTTLRISADGGYSCAANRDQGEQRPLSDTVLAAEKKWTVKTAAKKVQTGTYILIDDTTLSWTVHGGVTVKLNRVTAHP
jgi:hypothetical protein